jgi:peptidoglycan/LPS O-acetylase OafA/YrhL
MVALGIAGTAAGLSIDGSLTDWRALPAHLTMTHAWGLAPTSAFNHPSWSISAEWFAYLTFPAYAFAAWRLRERPVLAVAGAVVLALAIYAAFEPLAGFSLTEATFRWGALRIVPCFALGCALYLVHRRAPIPYAGPVALISGAAMLASASLGLWDPVTVLLAGAMILGLGSLDNARAGLMGSKAAVYLGEISYSIYMVCAPVLLVMTNVAARLTGADDKRFHIIVWLAVVAAIPVAAMASYHLVERPCRKALRGIADRRRARLAATKPHTDSPERVLQPTKTIV